MMDKLIDRSFLYLCLLVVVSSCVSSVKPTLPVSTSLPSPGPGVSSESVSTVPTQTPAVTPAATSLPPTASAPGCQFVYSIPARINVEYMIGSSLYLYYKSITLEVNYEDSTLQVTPQEGSVTVYSLTPSVAESTLHNILVYLCKLEHLPGGQSDQPVHSPVWQMTLKLAGGEEWTIVSTGVILIEGQAYTDINASDIKEPGILLGDLAEKQTP